MKHDHDMKQDHYKHLIVTTLINAVIMYLVMYTMINGLPDFYNNINQLYMVFMMAAPMVTIMLIDMKSMFKDKRLNLILHASAAALVILGFAGMRTQAAVGDSQFLRAMIPHHSGAILMCREASLTDPEIEKLCEGIIKSQQAEIDQMKAMLTRY
ncbi:MAG: DUF305 domain-containing protein [Rhodospirillaceae bacterium]|jgi:uncharacterized protein (DUF305 family)